jgi:carboxypeptidase Q
MRRFGYVAVIGMVVGGAMAPPAGAQTLAVEDPVLRRIWEEGMNRSQLERLSQVLMDSLGPRLTGSPETEAAQNWVVQQYRSWGIPARNERYGTWLAWRRGITHVDLLTPRVRSLEAINLAWSPGTNGPVTGQAVVLPAFSSAAEFEAWLPQVRGRFVLTSFPQPTCRPDYDWEQFALPESFSRMRQDRTAAQQRWTARVQATGLNAVELPRRLEAAGAAGIVTSNWATGWGVNRIFNGRTRQVPTMDLSCEDYGLVYRLAENGQGPTLRVNIEAEFLGERPVANTLAEVRGRRLPNEYVMLSAHFDSWDGSSGATDNGTGTMVMMEAMRILRIAYPQPRRTILAAHWNGEEQGLNGSRAFVEDNPRIVQGLQALFNQDNGTGRVVRISGEGFVGAAPFFARWLARVPQEISRHITVDMPGTPRGGGTDHASFVCAGAPGFNLSALEWNYFRYTWHTNRDTWDKIVFDDLRNNAVLTAMLVYLASEDPQRMPRERRVMPVNPQTGQQMEWPECGRAARQSPDSPRM